KGLFYTLLKYSLETKGRDSKERPVLFVCRRRAGLGLFPFAVEIFFVFSFGVSGNIRNFVT
ncbi:MAG: hypothetical protein K2I99_00700, partial [Bacteroidaceae bacterium]|nr:hypothetical protein [Bacteroidaceae bacterium]